MAEQPDTAERTIQRIDELETRLALQDQSILQMSDEIYRQQQDIATLLLQVRELVQRVNALAAQAQAQPPPAEAETPPHY